MGKLLKPRGLKGVLRLWVFNEVNSTLRKGKVVWVELESGKYSNLLIESLKISGEKSWIKFSGCDRRKDADQLSGLQFSIPRSDFVALSDKEFYLVDLIGCSVLDENQNSIGFVIDTLILPAQNMLVVEKNGNEVLIPFINDHVTLFDKKENILILKDVEGLLN